MNKSFRTNLKKIILLGTIIPIVCFLFLFAYKFISISVEADKELFSVEFTNLSEHILQNIEKKQGLLNTSTIFLSNDDLLNNKKVKKEFLDRLVDKSSVVFYYYQYNDVVLSNSTKIEAFSSIKTDNQYLIIGNNRLTLAFVLNEFENDIKKYLDQTYSFKLESNDHILINDLTEIINEEDINLSFINKSIKYNEKISDDLILSMKQNISGEIESILKMSIIYFIVLIIFILLMTQVVFFSSRSLLKPLNLLIEKVTGVANESNGSNQLVDGEYKEIFESFDEMVESVNNNIRLLKIQAEEINDKNINMVDMNEQLESSLVQLESSTRQLEILEKQSKILVDHIKDLMWVIDSKGRIIYINNVVHEKLGYSVDDLIGVKIENILFRDYKNEEAYQEMFYDDYDGIDLRFVTKDKEHEEIFSCATKRVFHNDKLVRIQGVCHDITEERYLESQMEQKNMISQTLNEISEILTRPEKLEYLLKHIVIRIERLLDPLICTIRMVDDKGRLELKAGIGECYDLVQEKYLDIDKDISGRAIIEGKIIIISDKNESDYHNYDEVFSIVEQSKELVFLPLEYDGTTIGVMSIGLRDHLSDADLKILKVFTNQASAAIEKARMYEEIEGNYLNIIKALASTVEAKDAYTENHSIRVSMYSRMIAEELGLSDEEVGYIDIAGLLHDIGKIGVSDLTLTKTGSLSDDEFHQIKKHPLNGGRIVAEMKLHRIILEGVLLHHKRFDLKGYPNMVIDSLPLSARIIGVADAFDAMTSNRSYQKAKSFGKALEELRRCSGTQFCPEIVKVMDTVVMKLEHITS